jgi:2-dehydropantoate 2-reductase
MTIQNGVENEEILCKFFPRDAVMGGNSRVGAEVVAPGKVLHTALGRIEFGELTTDLKTIRWQKLMGNNSTNSVGTLSRTTLDQMLADPDGFALVRTLMIETVIVGRAEGANMSEERVDPYSQALVKSPQIMTMKPSTLQDLEKGKRLEYDGICGAVLRAARRHGIKVPATETVYTLLKLLDGVRESGPR